MTTDEMTDTPTLDPTTPSADELYAFALQLAVTGHSLTDAAQAIRELAGDDETPIESALTLAECGCRDTPLALAARQAMYVLGRALLTEEL